MIGKDCKKQTVNNFCSSVPWQGEPLLLGVAVMAANCIDPFDLGRVFPFYSPGRNTICHKDLQNRTVMPEVITECLSIGLTQTRCYEAK